MKEPTAAELIHTATRLLAAAQRTLKKKPTPKPRPPRRPPKDRIATPEEVAACFANIRAMLAQE
jgi:uracil-DNA glycosylase